jgi:hypothetical protein
MKIEISNCKNDTQSSKFSWKPICASSEKKQNSLKKDGSFNIQIYQSNFVKIEISIVIDSKPS